MGFDPVGSPSQPTFLREEADTETKWRHHQRSEDTVNEYRHGREAQMALDFSKVKKSGFGGNGGGNRENIAIEFKSVDVVDQKKATPAEDVINGYLLHDALGLRAEFDDEGNPITEVRVRVNDKRKSKLTGEFAPLEAYDLPRKKGNSQATHPGGVVVCENCFLEERTGTIVTGWLSVASRNPAQALETAHTGLPVTVENERYSEVEEGGQKVRKYRQNRYLAIVDKAATFGSLEQFKANAELFLKEEPAAGGGRPGFWVRLIDQNDPSQVVQATITMTWDRDNQRMNSAQEVVDAWLADPDNAQWASFVNAAGTPDGDGYVFEQIPFFRFSTGAMSLPSKSTKGRDDAENFRIRAVDDEGNEISRRDNGDPVMTNGFGVGIMVVRRQEDSESANWFATRTFIQDRFGKIYARKELVTPNLPANIAALFEDRATERGVKAHEAFNKRFASGSQESKAAAETDADYSGDVGFGEPDHRGGLTPR